MGDNKLKNKNIQIQILDEDVRLNNINYSFWDRLRLLIFFWKPGSITLKNPSINLGGKLYKITKSQPAQPTLPIPKKITKRKKK